MELATLWETVLEDLISEKKQPAYRSAMGTMIILQYLIFYDPLLLYTQSNSKASVKARSHI